MSSNYIIIAERNSGKTTFATSLIKEGKIDSGILSLANEGKTEYRALNIESGESRIILSEKLISDSIFSRFKIDEASFSWANSYLESIESGAVLIDEIGRLELEGKGFAPALQTLLKKDVTLYIAVRTSFLEEVINKFNIESYTILNGSSL